MTVPSADPTPLTWDDLDRLADWTAGQLTGPDADHIAHLVATDPRWTHAHTTITTNQPTITNALNTTAPTPHEPIPHDILTRLTTALHNATPPHPASSDRSPSGPGRSRPGARASTATRPASRRHGRRPVLAGIAAIVLLACGFGGLKMLLGAGTASDAGRYNAEVADSPAPQASLALGEGPPAVTSSPLLIATGTDYDGDSLGAIVRPTATGDLPPLGPLEPLAAPDRLRRCIGAIGRSYPGTPEVVDFARFKGRPAAVMLWSGTDGPMVIAVSADCDAGHAGILAAVEHA